MALDVALMDSVRDGGDPALRFYRWDPPCLSLGRNQPARGHYDTERLRERGFDVVRRPTGGRAVLHDRELTYSVVLPADLLGGPRQSYAAVNRALVRGLRRLGVAAELQVRGGRRAAVPSLDACFRDPAEGEVVVGGRKLVGSAQFREAGVILQHGSLLFAGDQAAVRTLLRTAAEPEADSQPPATLADLLDPVPPWKMLTAALAAGVEEEFALPFAAAAPSAAECERATRLLGRFQDPAWTWRL
jgi:lipoyl(octanoyl) transferase